MQKQKATLDSREERHCEIHKHLSNCLIKRLPVTFCDHLKFAVLRVHSILFVSFVIFSAREPCVCFY